MHLNSFFSAQIIRIRKRIRKYIYMYIYILKYDQFDIKNVYIPIYTCIIYFRWVSCQIQFISMVVNVVI